MGNLLVEQFFDTISQYVSWVEALWVMFTSIGVIRYVFVRYRHVYRIRRDYIREDSRHKYSSVGLQLNIRAFRFLSIGLIFWIWMFTGLRAMLTPNPPDTNETDQILLALLLLSGTAILFLKGEMIDSMENKAYAKYREELLEGAKESRDDVQGYLSNEWRPF
jgi:hypothetical protein